MPDPSGWVRLMWLAGWKVSEWRVTPMTFVTRWYMNIEQLELT